MAITHGRFVFYSHDGYGLGHLRRHLAIAAALTDAAPDASVLLATGCNDLGTHGLAPNVDVLVLPGLRKLGKGRYAGRRLPMAGSEIAALRSAQLETAVRSFRPDVMLVDKHPAGVRGELRGALSALIEDGGRAALGVRDILDDPAMVVAEWEAGHVVELTQEHFDRLLVYGEQRVLDVVDEYGLPESLARRVRYCGYVVHPEFRHTAAVDSLPAFATGLSHRPTVLATTGGGEDGSHLLRCFLQAAHDAPWDGVAVSGPQLATAERHALRRMAVEAGVEFHATVPDVSSWFSHVDALVCMGGYNTLGEALARGTPTICVPRVHPRQEQLIRARAFERLGLLRVVEPESLEPRLLRRQVASVLGSNRSQLAERAQTRLGFEGAQRAAEELLRLAQAGSQPARRFDRARLKAVSDG
jgi:predicted glycosyltransferase